MANYGGDNNDDGNDDCGDNNDGGWGGWDAMEILLDALIGVPQARFCPRGGGTNSKRYLWCMSLNLACCENTFFLTLLERDSHQQNCK
uniref:Uncharacterized protein n=1 Tax=Oryza glaberrima TaxID=4538 RepID=I1R067_ORYGL